MKQQNEVNQKNNTILYIILSSLITILVIGGGIFLWQNTKLKNTKYILNTEINKLQNRIVQLQQKDNNISDETFYFSNLSERSQKKDATITLVPNNGFFITTSILSNKNDKVVYSEISESIKNKNIDYWSGWEYNIYVKDLTTSKTVKIYSYPEKVSLKKLFIKPANAGGCPIVYFPIAWSKNDKKIILEWGNPTQCGSGGVPQYESFTIDPNGGKITALATYNALFLDNYSKVISVNVSDKSPIECGPSETNYGAIVLTDIEDSSEKTLTEENNSYYTLKNIDENQNLIYTVKKVTEVDGCSEIDDSFPEKPIILKIK